MSTTSRIASSQNTDFMHGAGQLPALRWWLTLLGVVALLLSPMLCFPQSFDHTMFLRGADCLLQGGHLYRDYIDIKPPLLYYFFALVRAMSGHGEMGFRAFDMVYQSLSSVWLAYVCLRLFNNRPAAAASAILYALCYIAPGFAEVMQPDCIATPLISTVVLLLITRPHGYLSDALVGLACALLFSLKYTLGIALPFALIVMLWLQTQQRAVRWQRVMWLSLGLVPGLCIGFFAFADAQTRVAYGHVLDFLRYYTSHPPMDAALLKTALKAFGTYMGDMLSISIVTLVVMGVIAVNKSTAVTTPTSEQELELKRKRDIVAALLLFIVLLWLSVLVEKKFLINHFMRAFVPMMVLAGLGYAWLREQLRLHPPQTSSARIVWMVVLLAALLFSPLPRWMSQVQLARLYVFDRAAYDATFEDAKHISFERVQVHQVREYIEGHRKTGDKTFVMGVGIIPLYDELQEPVWSRSGASCFYFADNAPAVWIADMHEDLQKTDWLVVATHDNNPVATGNGRSSYDALRLDSTASAIVDKQFELVLQLRSINLYHRRAVVAN